MFWGIIGMMVSIARTEEEAEQSRLAPGLVRLRYQRMRPNSAGSLAGPELHPTH